MWNKKNSLCLPSFGIILYLIAIVLIFYATIVQEGWFWVSIPDVVLVCYLVVMFIILISGNIKMFVKAEGNSVRKKAALVFMLGLLILVLFSIDIIVVLYTSIDLQPIIICNTFVFYPICILLVLILFAVGVILFRRTLIK